MVDLYMHVVQFDHWCFPLRSFGLSQWLKPQGVAGPLFAFNLFVSCFFGLSLSVLWWERSHIGVPSLKGHLLSFVIRSWGERSHIGVPSPRAPFSSAPHYHLTSLGLLRARSHIGVPSHLAFCFPVFLHPFVSTQPYWCALTKGVLLFSFLCFSSFLARSL